MTTVPVMTTTDEVLDELEQQAEEVESIGYDAEIERRAIEHIRILSERLEKAEKNTERYLWLRDRCDKTFLAFSVRTGYSAKKCDAAIDAALAQESAGRE